MIEATADEVQDHVLEARVPWMRVADVVMFRADEWMATQMLRRWRDDVWATAVVLLDDPDPARRAGPLAKRCAVCERRARRILAVGSGGP